MPRDLLVLLSACIFLAGGLPVAASAHGDVIPQTADTYTLPQSSTDWRQDNPYRTGPVHDEALCIGISAFNQNCAHYHGLEVISGGIAPDLRKFDAGCMSLVNAKQGEACYGEASQYSIVTARHGRIRGGRIYMLLFKDVLTQEAVWSIKMYLESRRVRE